MQFILAYNVWNNFRFSVYFLAVFHYYFYIFYMKTWSTIYNITLIFPALIVQVFISNILIWVFSFLCKGASKAMNGNKIMVMVCFLMKAWVSIRNAFVCCGLLQCVILCEIRDLKRSAYEKWISVNIASALSLNGPIDRLLRLYLRLNWSELAHKNGV